MTWNSIRDLTCHYCAYKKKDTEKDVSCQCAIDVDDLPLADSKYNPKYLHMHDM